MWNIILLGLTSLLTDISTEMVYPLIPLFLTVTLGASPAILGLIEGIAESLASLLKIYAGHHSDRIARRKPVAVFGYAFSTMGKLLFYFAAAWPMVLAGRVADRFGKGIRTAPRDALIAESATEQGRGHAFGLHRALDTLGAVIGVLLAFYFVSRYKDDLRPIFLWSLVPAALGVGVLFFVREKKTPHPPRERKLSLNWRGLPPQLKKFLIVVFLFALGNSSNQFLLLRASGLGFSIGNVLLLYLTFNLVYSLLSYPAGRLSDKIGRRSILVIGYAFYGLVYLGFALIKAPAALWLLFGLYGVYYAMTEGVEKALIADLCPSDRKATFMGLHAMLTGIGLLPASLLAGWLWGSFGPESAFAFGGALGITAAIGMAVVLRGKSCTVRG
jgi:MFS family permease